MQIAILTFDGFNEIDSFVAATILNRMRPKGWRAHITAPSDEIISMNGVVVRRQRPLAFAAEADAVMIGSGTNTMAIATDDALLGQLELDPTRQLIGAQCSGALILARLGFLAGTPACTDTKTLPLLLEEGVEIAEGPFVAHGRIATAGGCLASHYLAAWLIARGGSWSDAADALGSVAPVAEEHDWIARARRVVGQYLPGAGGCIEPAYAPYA